MPNPFEIDPTPILSTSFLTLVDKRQIGSPFFRSESYTISSSYTIRLVECPEKDSPSTVAIPTFTEVTSIPTAINQFLVDYVNGNITFYATPALIGTVVTVSYKGLGSILQAADVNNVTSSISGGLILRTTIIATSGQTIFTPSYKVSATATLVYSNGLLMTEGGGADYTTALNGSHITFNVGRSTGDVVNFINIGG